MKKELAITFLLCSAHPCAQADSPILLFPENGHRYQRFDTAMTWQEAKAFCETWGGHLATITSQAEDEFVWSNLASAAPGYGTWLGATDEIIEGEWAWVTGEPWSYTNWDSGEPNNFDGIEHYLHYWFYPYWNDMNKDGWGNSHSTLCEVSGTPFASLSAMTELEFGPRATDDSFEGTAKFELSSESNGIDPLHEDVTLTLGTLSITVPAGSFKTSRQDDGMERTSFSGVIDGVRLTVIVYPEGPSHYKISVSGKGANLDGVTMPPAIKLTIGDDYGQSNLNSGEGEFEKTKVKHHRH